jgi:hypothetical protein
MKQVDDIAQDVLISTNMFATACYEIHVRSKTGLWPKRIAAMGPFIHALQLEGYPYESAMNIAVGWVQQQAIYHCSIS